MINTTWETGKQYKVGDIVNCLNSDWYCIKDHKSDTFAKDVIEYRNWKAHEVILEVSNRS